MSLLIGDNLVVIMHYKLTDDQGSVLDSSEGGDPLTYLHGAGNIIAGLEKALVGKTVGDALRVRVEPEEGYGLPQPGLVQAVPREAFSGVDAIEVGMTFVAQGPNGAQQRVVVTEISDDEVTVDANHPLAGVPLNFDVQIVAVREATQDEIAHGHAH